MLASVISNSSINKAQKCGVHISIDVFKRWFNDDKTKRKLAEVHKKTFFALLLEESENRYAGVGAGSAEVSDDMAVEELDEGDAKAYKDIAKTLDKKEGFLKAAWKRIGERRGIDAVDFGEWDDDPRSKAALHLE